MNRRLKRVRLLAPLAILALARCQTAHADGRRPITLASLIQEMADREATARLPAAPFTLKQVSSHDIAKRDPGDPQTWHSNHDYEQFLRTEVHEGRREWVIMDDTGPGAITRFWLPLNPDHDNQVIRFYFDGASTPAIAVKFNDLLSGRAFVPPPFAFVAWNDTDIRRQKETPPSTLRGVAGDLYLPIPFAAHCKITLDQIPFYYIIDYRAYAPGTPVRTFTMSDFQAAGPLLDRVGRALTKARASLIKSAAPLAPLAPGDERALELEAGPHAISELLVTLDPKAASQALRSAVIEARFDDEPTVWCPVGEFFGTGARLHGVQDWRRSVSEEGRLSARWIMPYRHTGRLALKNTGDRPISIALSASTTPWNWDDRSLYFHANWHAELGMKTRPYFDWNYLEIQGEGRYAGDTLTVFSPVGDWYGEGDERIYIDGDTFPAHIGTGTEDYYGYAWGMATYFSSPFLSAPLRDTPNRGDWRGYTTTSRLRLLDDIPLRTDLKVDMEIWNWADTRVDYAVATFWYARPGAKHNRPPQPQEAAVPLRSTPLAPGAIVIPGAIECESMRIAGITSGVPTEIQNSPLPWSGGKQLLVRGTKSGDYVELEIPTPDDQPRRVTLYGTKSYDYGVLRFLIGGQQTAADYDAYAVAPVESGPIDLGFATPNNGKLLFRIQVIGHNAAARGTGSYFGLDCVVLNTP